MFFRLKVAGRRMCHSCPVTHVMHAAVVRDLVGREAFFRVKVAGLEVCHSYHALHVMSVAGVR